MKTHTNESHFKHGNIKPFEKSFKLGILGPLNLFYVIITIIIIIIIGKNIFKCYISRGLKDYLHNVNIATVCCSLVDNELYHNLSKHKC